MVPDKDRQLERKTRRMAVMVAATMVLWIGAQWLGGTHVVPMRYVILFDLAALAAFLWAMVVIYRIWRDKRQQD